MTSTIITAQARDRSADALPPMMTGSRLLGALVAGGIAATAALLGLWLSDSPFLALGIPAAAVSGWLLGPSIRTRGGIVGAALAMATLTIAIADSLFIAGAAAESAPSIVDALGGWTLGLLFVGIPMLIVTVPCGVVWALVVRKLARDGVGARPVGNSHVQGKTA